MESLKLSTGADLGGIDAESKRRNPLLERHSRKNLRWLRARVPGTPGAGDRPRYASAVRAPDAIDPVVGWRCWRVFDAHECFSLRSACRPFEWLPERAFRASCDLERHEAPAEGCACGVYAARSPSLPLQYLPPHVKAAACVRTPAVLNYDRILAFGRVALWGDVVECEWGWRAALAYPIDLWLPAGIVHFRRHGRSVERFDSASVASELGRRYGVPVRITSRYDEESLAA